VLDDGGVGNGVEGLSGIDLDLPCNLVVAVVGGDLGGDEMCLSAEEDGLDSCGGYSHYGGGCFVPHPPQEQRRSCCRGPLDDMEGDSLV